MRSEIRAARTLTLLTSLLLCLAAVASGGCHASDLLVERNSPPDTEGPDPGQEAPPLVRALAAHSGNGQSDTVSATLGTPYRVRVTDGAGAPVPGIEVAWQVFDGGGTVSPARSLTDATGLAQATATLGTALGTQRVRALATGATGVATFTATVRHGAVHAIEYEVNASDVPMGAAISPAIRVVLRDRIGHVAADATGGADIALVDGTGTPFAQLTGTNSAALADGRATFPEVRVSLVGSGYRLRVSTRGLSAETRSFDVTLLRLP